MSNNIFEEIRCYTDHKWNKYYFRRILTILISEKKKIITYITDIVAVTICKNSILIISVNSLNFIPISL